MTPKNKAKELTDKYIKYTPVKFDFENARQCALIAVNEIINSIENEHVSEIFENYWEKVKKEIQNL